MVNWEYIVHLADTSTEARSQSTGLENVLSFLGRNQWELVSVLPAGPDSDWVRLILKRQLIEKGAKA